MKELIKNLKFTWKFARKQYKSFIKLIITLVLYIGIDVIIPILSAKQIVRLTKSAYEQLILISLVIYLIENLRNILHFLFQKYITVIYRETLITLQGELGFQMLKMNNTTIDKNGSGMFIYRLSNDTSKMAEVFWRMPNYIAQILTNVGIFGALFVINKLVFLYLLTGVVILYFLENNRTKIFAENDKVYRKETEAVSGFVSEMVRGIRDIKMLNSEKSFLSAMKNRIQRQNDARYSMVNFDNKYRLLICSFKDLSTILLIGLVVFLLKRSFLSVAIAIVVYNYSKNVSYIINDIGGLLELIKDFNVSSERVMAIIEGDEFEKEKFGTRHLDHVKGNFEFIDVSFNYDKEGLNVLNNLSFKVNANETVAFVGKSGAGKSTIFSLLCKLYDASSGKIKIDGVDINELDKDSIRGNITIISQNPYIFNLSIKDNLKLVKENVTDEKIKWACKLACLDDFIEELPKKYDTIVGEGGVTLSGGERQRLAIARALVQKTEIILFDEATSALDNETQNKIQQAIQNMKGEYTILIIAHRLSTIINADRILMIDDGKIIAEGTHEGLLKNNKDYKRLYESELKRQENA